MNTPETNAMQRYKIAEIKECSALLPIGFTGGAMMEIGTDVTAQLWGDTVTTVALDDCEKLPCDDNSIYAIMVYDGIHKIDNPTAFFTEVERILAPQGRIILTAPAVTPLSWVIYKIMGKRLNIKANPLQGYPDQRDNQDTPNTAPFAKQDPNYYMPSLLFWFQEHRIAFNKQFPRLQLVRRQWTGYVTYLPAQLPSCITVSERWYDYLFHLERWLRPFVGRLIAPKCRIVLEKRSEHNQNQP